MSDLISRRALCEYALNQKDKSVTPNDIMRFPSAGSKRKKGKWLKEMGTYMGRFPRFVYHCSKCGYVEEHAYADSKCSNFCSRCGADMRGEQDESD